MSAKDSFSSSTQSALLVLFSAVISFSSLLRVPWLKAQFLGITDVWGPQKGGILLSLQMMEPRTIGLCQRLASLELLSCSSHLRPLRKHLSQRHIAAKRSLYSVLIGLGSLLCRRGNRRSRFRSSPFQPALVLMPWFEGCAKEKMYIIFQIYKRSSVCCGENHFWGGEHTAVTFPVEWKSATLLEDRGLLCIIKSEFIDTNVWHTFVLLWHNSKGALNTNIYQNDFSLAEIGCLFIDLL